MMLTPPLTPYLPIGYRHLDDFTRILVRTSPLYATVLIETTQGNALGQHTEHYFLMLTQPDWHNRVHYFRLPLTEVVYLNGVPFDADPAAKWQLAHGWRDGIAEVLTGKGYTVIEGMAALPQGYTLIEGSWLAKRVPEQ